MPLYIHRLTQRLQNRLMQGLLRGVQPHVLQRRTELLIRKELLCRVDGSLRSQQQLCVIHLSVGVLGNLSEAHARLRPGVVHVNHEYLPGPVLLGLQLHANRLYGFQ